jgi:integrase
LTIQLALPDVLTRRELAFERAMATAARHVQNQRAERTRRAYAVQWRHWLDYCDARGIAELPIAPAELIVFLTLRGQEASERTGKSAAPNTVRLALSALSVIDQTARITAHDRHPPSLYRDPLVRAWLKAWSRENPKAPRKKAPVMRPRSIEAMLACAAERPAGCSRAQHIAQYARDRAMLLIGVGAAMRISELVGLNVGDIVQADRGLHVYVRRSKTDQHGEGDLRGVSPAARIVRCPVDAWRAWLALRGTREGPAFVAIKRSGELSDVRLSDSGARRIIARRAAAAGLTLVTSHSMRATFATLAVEQRKPLHKIAQQGGWASYDTLRGYIRQGELFDDNPSAGLLDD